MRLENVSERQVMMQMKKDEKHGSMDGAEHIMVCLSASPSNEKIIKTAAKMASAFGGSFTALYVKSVNSDKMDEFDKKRLQRNIQLAEQLGAEVTITHGEDVSFQIAEYARISGVTQIVIGRSSIRRCHFWSKPTLSEKLTEIVPNLDIHIIPDGTIVTTYKASGESVLGKLVVPNFKDVFIMLLLLVAITLLGLVFYQLGFTEANVIAIYILGVLLISLFTRGYACGIVGS